MKKLLTVGTTTLMALMLLSGCDKTHMLNLNACSLECSSQEKMDSRWLDDSLAIRQTRKSSYWEDAYTFMRSSIDLNEEDAANYAGVYEQQADNLSHLVSAKSPNWVFVYTFMRYYAGAKEEDAITYTNIYEQQRQAGKSDRWAFFYMIIMRSSWYSEDYASDFAHMIDQGQDEGYAKHYADTQERKRQAGKSPKQTDQTSK